jgi:hypothetical protein
MMESDDPDKHNLPPTNTQFPLIVSLQSQGHKKYIRPTSMLGVTDGTHMLDSVTESPLDKSHQQELTVQN